jgi:aldehyde:ferredoxin oxidoreductase
MGRIRPQQKAEDVEESETVEELIGDLKLEAENFADMQKATATITARSKDLKGMLSKGSTRLYDCIKDAEKVLRMMQPDPDDMPDLPFKDSDSKAGAEES